MPTHPRLMRRGQTFYLRAAVPAALRPALGKREITRSLKTRDPRDALRRVRIESVRVDEQFEAARRQQRHEQEPPQPDLSEEQLRELKAVYYRHLLEQDEEIRLAGFHDPDEPEETLPEHPRDTFDEHEEGSEDLASHARRGYARGKADAFIRSEAEDLLDWDGVDIRLASGSPGWPRLYRAVQEALIEAGDAIAERNKGRVVQTPEAPVIRQAPPPGPLLSELIEERIAEQQRSGVSAKILHDYRTWLGYLIEIAGDRTIGSYTREDGRRFKATISRLPGNWAKKKGLKGLGVVKASEKAVRLEMEPMSVATVNKALSRVGAFWNWAGKHFDDVTRNIVEGQAIAERTSARDQRQPFTADDLTRIFSAPTYKGCDGERRWAYPGQQVLDGLARFWCRCSGSSPERGSTSCASSVRTTW
ncbi:DUF6538 domain-containing protein [Paroceanicella profunda]|uniref:DUF6538 domain-containing protein n=1 Tax=Paroceanicella profunda TaxID=2579971 RepID=UPI00147837C8|nr:DUF6538 domain-containing protein [Paroceanicella profunda]